MPTDLWEAVPLLPPWRPVKDFQPMRWRYDKGRLQIQGLAEGGGPTDPIFQLPSGDRPKATTTIEAGGKVGTVGRFYTQTRIDEEGYYYVEINAQGPDAEEYLHGVELP